MKLHWKILIGMGAGVVVGLLVNEEFMIGGPIGTLLGRLSFIRNGAIVVVEPILGPVGTLFINLLKMLIVPLIMASMVVGVGRVGDIRHLRGLGGRTFAFYLLTTWASVLVGLVVVNIIRPGVGAPLISGEIPEAAKTTVTLQFAKKGFENPEAQTYLGRLVIADIGIPEVCSDDDAWHDLMTR